MTDADWQAVGLSLQVALAATAVAAGPSLALGWLLARWDTWWTRIVEFAVLLPLVLPPVVTGYALLVIVPRGVAFTWAAAVLASAIVGLPLFVQLARTGFESVSPDVLDAARADGASGWRLFRHIVGPIAAPAVGAGATLHFARALGEFGATVVVAGNLPGRTQTLPLALFSRLQQIGGERAALWLAVVAVALAALSLGAARALRRSLRFAA